MYSFFVVSRNSNGAKVGSVPTRSSSRANELEAERVREAAAQAQKEQQQQFNRENQNEVDVSGILGANQNGGGSATMLTGAQGVNRNNMLLGGGSSLLGG